MPKLTSEKGVAGYFRDSPEQRFASTKSATGKSDSAPAALALIRNDSESYKGRTRSLVMAVRLGQPDSAMARSNS
jgi:hypothetical protein